MLPISPGSGPVDWETPARTPWSTPKTPLRWQTQEGSCASSPGRARPSPSRCFVHRWENPFVAAELLCLPHLVYKLRRPGPLSSASVPRQTPAENGAGVQPAGRTGALLRGTTTRRAAPGSAWATDGGSSDCGVRQLLEPHSGPGGAIANGPFETLDRPAGIQSRRPVVDSVAGAVLECLWVLLISASTRAGAGRNW